MTIAFNALGQALWAYAAIFACAGLGFLFLKRSGRSERGPGYWAASFFLNALGFVCWSGVLPLGERPYHLLGELFHIAGFFLLVYGAHAFTRAAGSRTRLSLFVVPWWLVWAAAILVFDTDRVVSGFMLKALRALLFAAAGVLILSRKAAGEPLGKRLSGWSLIVWGLFVLASAAIRFNPHLYLGFLVGFQMLAAFGMVAMLIERIRERADLSERRAQALEGILPICSYCKKIRDDAGHWQALESYIEHRSDAAFSHGICPECFAKHRPDR